MGLTNPKCGDDEMAVVKFVSEGAVSPIVLVCEHASNFIPPEYGALGLSADRQKSHIAWDLGALGVARHLAELLGSRLVYGTISRLIYDCNRPPHKCDAIPSRSEDAEIPGNLSIDEAERTNRVARYYYPFTAKVSEALNAVSGEPVLVTLHSFTPVYRGKMRNVDFGVVHDSDKRLADLILQHAAAHTNLTVRRNEPYGPEHGVTHTLKTHGVANGYPNVMLELRNSLLATDTDQRAIAKMLGALLSDAVGRLDNNRVVNAQQRAD